MDRLWQLSNLELHMMCYDVMETGHMTGYIQFIDNATVITEMHKNYNFYSGPFSKFTVREHFLHWHRKHRTFEKAASKTEVESRLKQYHSTFIKSFAGQCVATYVLGVRDRHPGNYMLHNPTGKFFHIDFGHFLDHCKKKKGFSRDREPFIYSKELQFFMSNFEQIRVVERHPEPQRQKEDRPKRLKPQLKRSKTLMNFEVSDPELTDSRGSEIKSTEKLFTLAINDQIPKKDQLARQEQLEDYF